MSGNNVVEMGDGCRGVHISGNATIRFYCTMYDPPLTLERSCSAYHGLEIAFPEPNTEHPIASVVEHTFSNIHSDYKPFIYKVMELEPSGDDYPTFVIRTDGAVLNAESFSIRGHVFDAEIIYHV